MLLFSALHSFMRKKPFLSGYLAYVVTSLSPDRLPACLSGVFSHSKARGEPVILISEIWALVN